MSVPQNSPEERINQDADEGQRERSEREIPPLTRRLSVLVDLGVPDHLDAGLLPSHIRMDDDGQSIICAALLIGCLDSGKASAVEGKPVVVLNTSEEDRDWLPKVSELATWGAKMIMSLLRLCWFGEDEKWIELNPLGQPDGRLYQVEGKAVDYVLKVTSEPKYPWAVLTLEESDGRMVQLETPAFYGDEARIFQVFYFPGDSMTRSSFSPSPLGD